MTSEEMANFYDALDEGIEVLAHSDPRHAEVFRTMMEAFFVYLEREEKYGSNWKQFGWRGSIVQIMGKAQRIRSVFWRPHPEEIQNLDRDDLVDIINYAVFAICNLKNGNEYGA